MKRKGTEQTTMKNMNDDDYGIKLHASPAVEEPPVQEDSRTNSYSQAEEDETPEDVTTTVPQSETLDPEPDPLAAEVTANPGKVFAFPMDSLTADPERNERFTARTVKDPDVQALANAIKLGGQLQPGRVMLALDGKRLVAFGTGRYLAISLINSTRAPEDKLPFLATAFLETADDTARQRVENGMENLYNKDLGPLDKMKLVIDLMEKDKLSQREVGQRLGLKPAMVTMYVKIAGVVKSSEFVKDAITSGKIAPSAVYDLTVVEPDKVEATVKKLLADSGGKKVSRADANTKARKSDSPTDKKRKTGGRPKGLKQRTAKQILSFIDSEATIATDKKYEDKALSKKLECFGAFVKGGAEATFLKNLAAL